MVEMVQHISQKKKLEKRFFFLFVFFSMIQENTSFPRFPINMTILLYSMTIEDANISIVNKNVILDNNTDTM